jgi:hypothetical protein
VITASSTFDNHPCALEAADRQAMSFEGHADEHDQQER